MQTGKITRGLRPDWEPLITLVGRGVVGCFAWKFALELDDGVAAHAYRNIATDRYLLLSVDGRAFEYREDDRYEEIAVATALETVFAGWEEARPRPRDSGCGPGAARAAAVDGVHRVAGLMAGRPGEMTQFERPVWEPLIDLVGIEVVGGFMWMHEVELDDGVELHAYKSIATRRYLHLAIDGRAFGYRSPGRYEEITRREALAEAFTDWEELLPQPRDPDAVRALLARA